MNRLVRFDPFADFEELQRQLFGSNPIMPSSRVAQPPADIYINDNKEVVGEFQLPGFEEEDIELSVHRGVLEIKAQKSDKQEEGDGKKKYVVRESSRSFYRQISLPEHADEDAAKAHFKNGMLKVTIPLKELPKPKQIQIGADSTKHK